MRAFAILTAIAVLAGASLSHASTIASPATYGADTQTGAQCIIGNAGTTAVPAQVSIVDELGNALPASNTCGSVPPQFICSVFASIPYNQAVACVASFPGSAAKLRGSLTIYAGSTSLRTSDLR
jgi:hypothetical protein